MKIKAKYIACIVIAVVLLCMYTTDLIIKQTYSIKIENINPQPAIADGKTPVEINIKLTQNGKLVPNHELYAIAKGGGSFSSQRIITDSKGSASFTYYPFLSSTYMKAGEIPIEVIDESNSIFISVPVRRIFTIKLIDPTGDQKSDYNTEDIYGDDS